VDAVTRNQLFVLSGALVVGAIVCLVIAASLESSIRGHVRDEYQQYADGRYTCQGTPKQTADDLAEYQAPLAEASDRGAEYLRYSDDIVIVGPDGSRPCTVRVEDLDQGYSHGSFIYLGPGFNPGSPAGGSGGSPGGPDGTK
jgi:hypothetical protein